MIYEVINDNSYLFRFQDIPWDVVYNFRVENYFWLTIIIK